MAKTLNQAGMAQRRNFRLSPLEMLIVALIILGVLYLMTIWVNSLLNQGSAGREVQSAPVPLAQMEQVLIASEKTAAKLISLEKALEQSRGEVAELKKALSSGSGNKALAVRVSKLEKGLGGKKSAPGAGAPKADPALAAKIRELEKVTAQSAKLAARVKELEKLADNEVRMEKSLRALDKRLAANEGLPEKVASLEKHLARSDKLEARLLALDKRLAANEGLPEKVASLEKHLALSDKLEARLLKLEKKPAADPALADKVRELEKRPAANPETEARLKVLEKYMNSGEGNEHRLRNLESGLVGLAQERGDVSRRLDRMERAVASLQRGKSSGAVTAPPISPPLENLADEQARKRLSSLSREVAELKAALAKLQAAPAKETQPAKIARPAHPKPAAPRAEAPAQPQQPKASAEKKAEPAARAKLIRHKVRRGDTLYGLARKYKVKVTDLRRWNPKLKGRKYLWVGESLILYQEPS